jgi:hypothetical protein
MEGNFRNGIFAIRPLQVKCKTQELLEVLKSYITEIKTNNWLPQQIACKSGLVASLTGN